MTASSKLSATELAAGYAADRATTDDLYRGKVLEVSGTIASVDQASNTIVMAGSDQAVWASLHEDVAADVLKAAAQGQRITLKCFCEGLETQVHLKSCVPPDSGR